jgi:hypothetical protein
MLLRGYTRRTSLFATGFPNNDRYTKCLNPASGSRSDSCAMRFRVRTSVVRLGITFERLAWIFWIRFWARKRVRNRGKSGKFPKCAMSLSVKSMASFSYSIC